MPTSFEELSEFIEQSGVDAASINMDAIRTLIDECCDIMNRCCLRPASTSTRALMGDCLW
jgi:hypothetical protein